VAEGLAGQGALAFGRAGVGADHLGAGSRLVDKDQSGWIKLRLVRLPQGARLGHVCSLACSVFLTVIRCRLKNRRSEASVVATLRSSASRCWISTSVRSFSATFNANSQPVCASSGERLLPPRGRGLIPPVSACSATQRIAEDIPTWNRAAA
jgi:hypothetical protein